MRLKFSISLLFYCIAVTSQGQNMMVEAFQEFVARRFWQYEEIPITWNMEGSIQVELNEGINNLLEELPVIAEGNFTKALEKDSTLWQAYYYRAAARKKQKKLRDAKLDLQRALKLHPDFYEGHIELAKVYHLRRENLESERELKEAIRLDKRRALAYYLRGDIDMEQDQRRNAINNYKECLEFDSLFHDARIKLSLIDLFLKKDEDVALRHLAQVLEYDSLQKSALLFRSIMLAEKDKKQSVKDLSNLILVSPGNLMARYLRGMLLTEIKEYDKAFSDFQEVIKSTSVDENEFVGKQTWIDKKIDIQNVGAYILTRVYGLSDGDAAKVKQAFCHILHEDFILGVGILNQSSNPEKEPLCLYLIAVAYEHKGDHTKAFIFYDRALRLDNDIADAHKKRGIYEQNVKSWSKSVNDFTEALRLTPDSYVIYKLRGVSNFYDNKFKEAISDYSKYLEHDSTNKEVKESRGILLLKCNYRLEAYTDLADAKVLEEVYLPDLYHLIDSILVTGDTAQVLSRLNHFTKAAPYFTEGYVMKFKILLARGEWKIIETEILKAAQNSREQAPVVDHSYLLTLLAMNYANHRHDEDAINLFTEAIKYDKANSLAYFERGKLFLAMGKKSRAENDLEKASSLGNANAKQLLEKKEN